MRPARRLLARALRRGGRHQPHMKNDNNRSVSDLRILVVRQRHGHTARREGSGANLVRITLAAKCLEKREGGVR